MKEGSGLSIRQGSMLRWGWLAWMAAPVLLWLSLREVSLSEMWTTLQGIHLWQMVVLIFLNLAILLLFALRWQMILRALGARISAAAVLAYRLAGFSLSYFTPGPQFGGEPLQVLLLNRRSAVPMATGVSSVLLDKIIELLANFSFLVFGFSVASLSGLLPSGVRGFAWVGIASVVFIPAAHLIWLWKGYRPLTALAEWLRRQVAWPFVSIAARYLDSAEGQIGVLCRERPLDLLRFLAVSVLVWLLTVLEFQWLVTMLGGTLSLAQTISLLTALRLAYLLPVPGGLGTMEAALVLVGQIVGLPPSIGLPVALLIRARDLSLAMIGLWFGGWAFTSGRRPVETA